VEKRLDIHPQTVTFGSVSNLLNGAFASLSGPVGFTPTQPRIHVSGIEVVNPSGSSVDFALYKGASGGNASGTEVFVGTAAAHSAVQVPADFVLESADFLTGAATSSGTLTVNISAEIGF
jgi:hypothetical protein